MKTALHQQHITSRVSMKKLGEGATRGPWKYDA